MAILLIAACSGNGTGTTGAEVFASPSVSSTTTLTSASSSTPTSMTPTSTAPGAASTTSDATTTSPRLAPVTQVVEFPVTPGSHPHDVAPAADGSVWYSGQGNGTLGSLDPSTGEVLCRVR